MKLVLVTGPDCHLCGHARKVLEGLGAGWRELSEYAPEGERLATGAPPLRPLLFTESGDLLAYGRLSERRLARELGRDRARG